jgi:hypothetical protein
MRSSIAAHGFAVILLAALHGVFAWKTRDMRPDLIVLSSPPSPLQRELLSFGDHAFLYRIWALDLQNAGDTGGRSTPMGSYDYGRVLGWLDALQALDPQAQHHIFLAARYFSLSPHADHVRLIVDFLVRVGAERPAQNWYWLTQAMTLAETRLKDIPYALAISQRISAYDFPEMPAWLVMYPAIFLEKLGRYTEAQGVIDSVKARRTLQDADIAWVNALTLRLQEATK